MAVKDHDKHYPGLNEPDATVQTPNTVSRYVRPGDRSFDSIIWQSGKPVLDSELQLGQDAAWFENYLLRRWQVPSGWLRGQTRYDSLCDYVLEHAPDGIVDDSPSSGSVGDSIGSLGGAYGSVGEPTSVGGSVGESVGGDSVGSIGGSVGGGEADDGSGILPDRTLLNAILLPRLEAIVAGMPIVVEYTYTRTEGWNLITLESPTIYDGTDGTVKRTDFLFLEVFRALVAPSPKATGYVEITDISLLAAGATILIGGLVLTAVAGAPAIDEFEIEATANLTAINIAAAVNLATNSFATLVAARPYSDTVVLQAVEAGVGGNTISLAETAAAGALALSGPIFTGGADRTNKPATGQDKLYRHGNVLSPEPTWLDDQMVDPVVNAETAQRGQIQYRIRHTGATEAINWKKHPDGFSNKLAGPSAAVYAQGTRSDVASAVNVGGGRFYPFVPADKATVWGNSSAVEYGIQDSGLWIAGDGSEQAAKDLGSVDGFVYAIGIAFLFRHNDASDAAAVIRGFEPVSNANGAPTYQHGGYNGVIGPISAGASDRPDAEYCDVITERNVLDLRRHVIFPGVDLASEVQYQMQSLMDGNLRTWQMDTASKQDLGGDSGDVSTRYLICNEIGRIADGNNNTSGDTPRGVGIRDFDHVARRFGSQSVVERVVFSFYPGDRPAGPIVAPGTVNTGKYVTKAGPGITWYEGDVLHLDLGNLDVTTLGGVFDGGTGGGGSFGGVPNFTHFAPPGTVITDVLSIYHDDGHHGTPVSTQEVEMGLVQGLGTGHLTVNLDQNDRVVNGGDPGNLNYQMVGRVAAPFSGSPRRIFVEVEITYPNGDVGATDTTDMHLVPDVAVYGHIEGAGPGPLLENDVTQRPNDFETLEAPAFRFGYREIQLDYTANNTSGHAVGDRHPGVPVTDEVVSRTTTDIYTPRRIRGYAPGTGPIGGNSVAVEDLVAGAPVAVDETATTFGDSQRKVVTAAHLSDDQCLCEVQYFPQDPIPNYGASGGGYQVAVYFRSNSPQTAGVKEGDIGTTGDGTLPTTLHVEPLLMAENLWTGQVGMGSVDTAFPYVAPLDQIPINDGSPLDPDEIAGTTGEWFFCATASITVDDFNADTGLLSLHPFVPADGQDVQEIGGTANEEKPRKDFEFRAFYPYMDETAYRPTILSQPLYGATRHKVFFPYVARAVEDTPGVDGGLLFRKDELLLVVLSQFVELDTDNNVRFNDTENRMSVGVYRTRNLLLLVGDRVCEEV